MLSTNDFFIKTVQKVKQHQIKKSKYLFFFVLSVVAIYLGNGPSESDTGIASLNPPKGTHCVAYTNQKHFDSYGCSLPNKLFKLFVKQNGYCLHSEHKIHGPDSFCAE